MNKSITELNMGSEPECTRGYGSLLIWLSSALPFSRALSSSRRLSPRAQCNESRIDSASRCPAGEMIGSGTEPLGWKWVLIFFLSFRRGDEGGDGSWTGVASYLGHAGGSRAIRINTPAGDLVDWH